MVKRVFGLNFIDAFISGILIVAVPIVMLEKDIDLATVGIVFSLAPLAKLTVRLASAALADVIGERIFYMLNALSNIAQAVSYSFLSAAGFAAGRIFSGAKDAFIWAVARTSIVSAAPEKKHFVLGEMVSGRAVYFALGSFAVWLLYPFGGFELLLLATALIALAALFFSIKIKNTPVSAPFRLSDFSVLGRKKRFYETSGAMMVGTAFYGVIFYLMLPIFFRQSGLSMATIAFLYALYSIVYGVVLYIISHMRTESKKAAFFGSVFFVISLCGIPFAPSSIIPWLFLLMAVGDGMLAILWEEIIFLAVRKSTKKSTDIALLHSPVEIVAFFFFGISGFMADAVGFVPIFIAGAISLVVFSVWCLRLAEHTDL